MYFLKTKDGKGYLKLQSPIYGYDDYIEITEEEFNKHANAPKPEPTEEQKAKAEEMRQVQEAKAYLASTDYVVIKIAEADSESERQALRIEYAQTIATRKAKRALINSLDNIADK